MTKTHSRDFLTPADNGIVELVEQVGSQRDRSGGDVRSR